MWIVAREKLLWETLPSKTGSNDRNDESFENIKLDILCSWSMSASGIMKVDWGTRNIVDTVTPYDRNGMR